MVTLVPSEPSPSAPSPCQPSGSVVAVPRAVFSPGFSPGAFFVHHRPNGHCLACPATGLSMPSMGTDAEVAPHPESLLLHLLAVASHLPELLQAPPLG